MKRIFAVIYDVMILALSYLLFGSISLSMNISEINGSIGIIGGAELPIVFFVSRKSPIMFFMVMFVIIGFATVALVTAEAFKNSCSMRLCITAVVFLIVTAILFVLIPPQTYVISLFVMKAAIIYDTIRVLYYIATATEIIIICKKRRL